MELNATQARNAIRTRLQVLGTLVVFIAVCMVFALGGCATSSQPGTQTLQQQVAAFCAVAPAEVQAFVAGQAALPADAQKALPAIQQAVSVTCAPGVVTTDTDLKTFVAVTLPAFTTIALEYAAAHKATSQ